MKKSEEFTVQVNTIICNFLPDPPDNGDDGGDDDPG